MIAARKPLVLPVEGAAFIGAFEGFRGECYDDGGAPGVGNCTIGYGHLVHYGPTTAADRRKWGALTRAQALRLLQADAHTALMGIERHITIKLTKGQLVALCSFAFNCGPDALAGDVGRAVNSKPRGLRWPGNRIPLQAWHNRVERALLEWDHAGGTVNKGLERRRRAEAFCFATGRTTRATGNPYANS